MKPHQFMVQMNGHWYTFVVLDGESIRWAADCVICGQGYEVVTSRLADATRKTCDAHHHSGIHK